MIDRIVDALVGVWHRAADWWANRHAPCTCEIGRTDPHCTHHGLSWP